MTKDNGGAKRRASLSKLTPTITSISPLLSCRSSSKRCMGLTPECR